MVSATIVFDRLLLVFCAGGADSDCDRGGLSAKKWSGHSGSKIDKDLCHCCLSTRPDKISCGNIELI